MTEIFMPESSKNERIRILQENAAKVEKTNYQKPLSESELADRKDKVSENCIALYQKEEEFKVIRDEFKSEINPLKQENKSLLMEIKTKQQSCFGDLYFIPDHERSIMDVYNDDGELVESRRLRPDEKQATIFTTLKTVANQ